MTPYAVHAQRQDSIPLAVMRSEARPSDLARLVPEHCGRVWQAMRAQQVRAGRHVAIYWDARIRLEVGVEVSGPFNEQGGIVRSATPAGLVASATHFGPYAGLGGAHEAIRQWCEAQGHHCAGPNWEIYGHWQSDWNADPSRIRTDVFYLVG